MKGLISKVKPGDSFRKKEGLNYDGQEGERTTHYKTWVVHEVYPYHVLAYDDEFERECFTYGELVEMGLEPQRPSKSNWGGPTMISFDSAD